MSDFGERFDFNQFFIYLAPNFLTINKKKKDEKQNIYFLYAYIAQAIKLLINQ